MSMSGTTEFGSPSPRHASIRWGHIDGPILTMRNRGHRWLSLADRVLLFFGLTTAKRLERKYWDKPDFWA